MDTPSAAPSSQDVPAGVAHAADPATERRLRAGWMMLAGHSPAVAAAAVGVARQTAYTWKHRLDAGGIEALRTMSPGRPARLDARQRQALRAALLGSARSYGFESDDWTLRRVRLLIERLWGVHFSEVHVGRLVAGVAPLARRGARRARDLVTSSLRDRALSRSGGRSGRRR